MSEYQFTKNSPSSFPTGRLLAKVDLALAAYGITVTGGLIVLLSFSPETLHDYATDNPEQVDIVNFLALSESKQLTVMSLYLSWYIFELILSIAFFFSTKLLSLNILKVWMMVTIMTCFLGLASAIPVYSFLANKPMFFVCLMIVYMYKLFSIYTIDLFLKEIVGRKYAGLPLL